MNTMRKSSLAWWQIILMAIGGITIVSSMMTLFFISSPTRPDTLKVSGSLAIGDNSLINTLSVLAGTPIIRGGAVEALNNGDEFFPRLYSDIEHAQSSINISTYIWKPGVVSDELFALLTKKANEGVTVRVILDGFGSKTASNKAIESLENAGGKVSYFHPARFGTLTKYHKRNHARAIVIDDSVGYTGGIAIADYWTGHAQDKDHWRDMMFRLIGEQVQQPKQTFNALWEITTGEVITASVPPVDTSSTLQSIGMTNLTPDEDIEQLSTLMITAITAAQQSLSIATPYMILDKRMQNALYDAKARGVTVKILVPGEIIDSKLVQSASQSYYKKLLEHGIELYEYTPTMLHSKLMIIDGKWSMIGSANIDTRSTFFNVENIVAIQDHAFGEQMQELFNNDITASRQITLEDWQNRSLLRKILEPLCSILDKQF